MVEKLLKLSQKKLFNLILKLTYLILQYDKYLIIRLFHFELIKNKKVY